MCTINANFGRMIIIVYNLDGCGNGYGNHVRILHPDGYLTIYAHLSYITIKDKSYVKIADKIGIEGVSGNAGKRHLHFGLHLPENIQQIAQEPGYTGISIPFDMRLIINEKVQILSSTDIICSNNLSTPLLKGVK
ncbi:Peptidase family M23 [Rickettsiales bacterium Ac37b]|nr:Peptidase family M23 [Rickettsiales bacterium Ac37b]AIL65471.1 Peptidase family M23 [Rickettsiales bacterium Ac37b]